MIVPFALWFTITISSHKLISILEDLSAIAMFEIVDKISLISGLVGFQDSVAVYDSHSPLAIEGQALGDQHAHAMPHAINKIALVVGVLGDFEAIAILPVIGVLAKIPTAIGLYEEPLALPDVIFEGALVEPAIPEDHNAHTMALPIEHLAKKVLVNANF
jgi:hypothetical protein